MSSACNLCEVCVMCVKKCIDVYLITNTQYGTYIYTYILLYITVCVLSTIHIYNPYLYTLSIPEAKMRRLLDAIEDLISSFRCIYARYVCVCMYVCLCVYTYVYICVFIYTHRCSHVAYDVILYTQYIHNSTPNQPLTLPLPLSLPPI